MPGTSGHLGTGPAGRGSAFGAHLDAVVGIHSWRQADTAAMARHFAGSDTAIWLPRSIGRGFTRIRGIGVSTVPLPDRSDLSAVRGSRMDWPWPLGAVQRAHHLACHPTGSTLVQSGGRVVGWHWPWPYHSVSYGRVFQAEALLLLCAAAALEAHSIWVERRPRGHSL